MRLRLHLQLRCSWGLRCALAFLDFAHLWSSEIVPHVVFLLCSWQQQEVKKKIAKKNVRLIYLKHENVKKTNQDVSGGFKLKYSSYLELDMHRDRE